MSEKRFRVNDLVKYDYSEIGEYIDENHTDRPLRNDEVCDLLNEQQTIIESEMDLATMIKLQNENIILKNKIEDLRCSLFMLNKELERQMQKSDLDE